MVFCAQCKASQTPKCDLRGFVNSTVRVQFGSESPHSSRAAEKEVEGQGLSEEMSHRNLSFANDLIVANSELLQQVNICPLGGRVEDVARSRGTLSIGRGKAATD